MTAAEQLLPDTIHHHACRQGIVLARDPVRQFSAAALRGRNRRARLRIPLQESARDFFAQGPRVTADGDPHVGRLIDIAHAVGARNARSKKLGMFDLAAELSDSLLEFVPLCDQFSPRLRRPAARPAERSSSSAFRRTASSRSSFHAAKLLSVVTRLFGTFGLLRLGFRQLALYDVTPHATVGLVDRLRAVKEAGHRIVITLRDRIELVVVAPSTTHGHAEKRLAGFHESVGRRCRRAVWPCRLRRFPNRPAAESRSP